MSEEILEHDENMTVRSSLTLFHISVTNDKFNQIYFQSRDPA